MVSLLYLVGLSLKSLSRYISCGSMNLGSLLRSVVGRLGILSMPLMGFCVSCCSK